MNFNTSIRVAKGTSRVIGRTVGLCAVYSLIVLFAVARTSLLTEEILSCSIREAGVPSLEVVSDIVRSSLDEHLRRLGCKVGRISPSRIEVNSIVEFLSIVNRPLVILPSQVVLELNLSYYCLSGLGRTLSLTC